MKYIDSEIILQRKIGPLIYVYIMIVIVIMLSLIMLFILYSYKTYITLKGVVISEDNHYYIRVYVPIESLNTIAGNNIVKIDSIEYNYKIISIDSEYFTDTMNTYQIIKIKVYLKDEYMINNLTLELNFLKENQRIIDYILK